MTGDTTYRRTVIMYDSLLRRLSMNEFRLGYKQEIPALLTPRTDNWDKGQKAYKKNT